MGCDIHLFAEKKVYNYNDKEKSKGRWVSLDKWVEREEFEYKDRPLEVPYKGGFYTHGRNYNLFSALANVRSHYFIDATFISEPKGMPRDASKLVWAACDDYGTDGHSHSWLTLKELKDFNWKPYGDSVKEFMDEVFPKLEEAKGKERTDEEVRIVFWFDN
ncbi:MAG: hypothetical protein WC208_10445 [Gallionella sp.]|jgi:hypothetical protein